MAKSGESHDICMTIGSTTYGFMLAKGEGGAKAWNVYDSPTLLPQYTSSEPGYGNYPPEREIVKSQSDWRGGFGHARYEGRPEYNLWGHIDARWKGHMISGPLLTTTTTTASAALGNSCVKLVEAAGGLYLATTTKIWKWNTTTNIWDQLHDLGSVTITDFCFFDGLLFIALGGSANYYVSDGTNLYQSSASASKTSYFSVGNTLLYSGTGKTVYISNTTTKFDRCPYSAPSVAAGGAGGVTAGTHRYKVTYWDGTNETSGGPASSEINASGATTIELTNIPTDPVTSGWTQRRIYRTEAGGSTYKFLTTLADNTTTAYTDNTADGGLTNTMPSVLTPAAAWAGGYTVGDSEGAITGLQNYRDVMYVGKTDGLYSITTTGTVTPKLDFRMVRSSVNFSKMCVFQDYLIFTIGVGGIYTWDTANLNYIGWDLLAPDTGLYPKVGAFAPAHDFLYVIIQSINNGGQGSIVTLRREDIDGNVDWRWHAIGVISTMDTPTAAYVWSGLTNPRLYIGGNDAQTTTNKPQYFILPRPGLLPDSDSNCRFSTGTNIIYTCEYDCGFPADRKLFTAVDVICSIPAGNTITIGRSIDGASSYTTMGAAIADTEDPVARRFVNAVGRRISFSIGFVSDSTSETPIVYGIAVRAVLRASRRKVYEFTVRVGPELVKLDGSRETIAPATLITQLKNADDPTVQTGVVTLYDRENTSHSVVFESMTEKEVADKPGGKPPERLFFIRAVEVPIA